MFGGDCRIRTYEALSRLPAFETGTLNLAQSSRLLFGGGCQIRTDGAFNRSLGFKASALDLTQPTHQEFKCIELTEEVKH